METEEEKPSNRFQDHVASIAVSIFKGSKKNWLVLSMLVAIVLAVIIGIVLRLREKPYTEREVMYAEFLGEIFIRGLRAITIPLFVCSVISALGNLNMKEFGKIGARALVYFVSTSSFAAALGLVLVLAMNPGSTGITDEQRELLEKERTPAMAVDGVLDVLRNMVPDNIIGACLGVTVTELIPPPEGTEEHMSEWNFEYKIKDATNYIGLVTIALLMGIVMGYKGNRVKSLLIIISAINEIFMKLTFLIIVVSPVPVLCLTLAQVLSIKNWNETMQQMSLYIACNMIGLFIISFIFFPALYFAFIRKNPFRYIYNLLEALTTALVTSSSIATLPVTMKCVEEKNHVDKRISRFVLPLGATVNMNGAALYTVIGPIFTAQLNNIEIGVGAYIGSVILAAVASVGAAGVPQGAVITMVMVMNFLNVPPKAIGIILSMDWFIDRWETAVNVMGDTIGCAIVQHLSRKDLEESDRKQD